MSVAVVSPAKAVEPMEMQFEIWTRVGRKKYVLVGVHTTHWRNLANTTDRPCAAAMRPVVKLL